jgi:hypothetical protein
MPAMNAMYGHDQKNRLPADGDRSKLAAKYSLADHVGAAARWTAQRIGFEATKK